LPWIKQGLTQQEAFTQIEDRALDGALEVERLIR